MTTTCPLPSPTNNPTTVLDDLRATGVAIYERAMDLAEIEHLHDRLDAIASAERSAGTALLEDGSSTDGRYLPGPNQRIDGLLSKDPAFARLATRPRLLEIARRAIAATYGYPPDAIEAFGFDRVMLSSMAANIANPGGKAMGLHSDQGFVPPATPFPVLVNFLVPLVDFTTTNGATLVAAGSHRADPIALLTDPPSTAPVTAAAGSVIVLDGRTVHGTGANTGDTPRPAILLTYCAPWVRTFGNHGLDVDDGLLADASPELLDLLGFTPWFVFGRAEARRLDRVGADAVDSRTPPG